MRPPLFIIRFVKYEYWSWWFFYLPVLPYWLYLSIKSRSLAYFSVANPGIELGGFFGESKSDILKLIDKHYLPKYIEINEKIFNPIIHQLKEQNISYPVISKPDVGERGNAVVKINNEEELKDYHQQSRSKYIIQEFVEYDIELGVLYSRLPNSDKGKVTSVTLKEFLSVTGDGKSTIKELMQKSARARFQIKRLSKQMGDEINKVLNTNEKKILEPIGNHCRGTRFIDNNFLINEKLNNVFDTICLPIKGFYYGRFDLKVKSIEDLYLGRNIKIIELNGASSEPGHIYDSSYTLIRAYKDLLSHWKRLAEIANENRLYGHQPVPFLSIVKSYWKFVVLKR
ncbi:MAG: hypothetical protein ACT4ON_03020 [Bacteroidota bacterium]